VIHRHEFFWEHQRRLAAGDYEHQLAWPGLRRPVGGDDGLAGRLAVLIEGLHQQELDSL